MQKIFTDQVQARLMGDLFGTAFYQKFYLDIIEFMHVLMIMCW